MDEKVRDIMDAKVRSCSGLIAIIIIIINNKQWLLLCQEFTPFVKCFLNCVVVSLTEESAASR